MSKVKPENLPNELINPQHLARTKESLRHQNRRYETRKKKRYRMEHIDDGCYCYYYIRDSRWYSRYERRVVPERAEPVYAGERITVRKTDQVTGRVYFETRTVLRKIGETIVPEHEERRVVEGGKRPIKPYLVKVDYGKSKKWHRQVAARRLRRSRDTELLQRGKYRRHYDFWWNID